MTLEERKQKAVDFILAIPGGVFAEEQFAPGFWAWTGAMGAFDGATFKQQIPLVGAVFPDGMKMVIDNVIGEDNSVSIQARASGRMFTGEDYRQDYLFIIEFDGDQKIRHFREYMDTRRVLDSMLPAMKELAKRRAEYPSTDR